jgi:type VII secretion-associated protein (TIGR03931 family)
VTAHRTVIETGPGTVRRLCCGTGEAPDVELASAALDDIDDTLTLVDEQPMAVAALWETVLESLACPEHQCTPESALIVYPSWWSESRVDVVTDGARALAENVVTKTRAQVLTDTFAGLAPDTATRVVIEIATRVVAVTAVATVAEPRSGPAHQVAEAVVSRVAALTHGAAAAVLIDGPDSVDGAGGLAELIAERLCTEVPDAHVQLAEPTWFTRLVAAPPPIGSGQPRPQPATAGDREPRRIAALAGMVLVGVLACTALGVGSWSRQGAPAAEVSATTFLVEGRVALQVPADWPMQRVTAGPGSARVEVISPSDPQVVLHMTQSPVPVETLSATAESLKRALERANAAAPAGVFVDFNPSGRSAGRPAVTYREVREDHHVDWTVLVDGAVRISIGCQRRPDGADAVREVCEQAVRSARALR